MRNEGRLAGSNPPKLAEEPFRAVSILPTIRSVSAVQISAGLIQFKARPKFLDRFSPVDQEPGRDAFPVLIRKGTFQMADRPAICTVIHLPLAGINVIGGLHTDGVKRRPRVSGPSQIMPAANTPETRMQPAIAPASMIPRS